MTFIKKVVGLKVALTYEKQDEVLKQDIENVCINIGRTFR